MFVILVIVIVVRFSAVMMVVVIFLRGYGNCGCGNRGGGDLCDSYQYRGIGVVVLVLVM